MKKMKLRKYLWGLFFSVLFSCNCIGQPYVISRASTGKIVVENEIVPDEEIENIITPYRIQLQAEMDEIIGFSAMELTKAKPESLLGNALCDIVEDYLTLELGLEVDMTLLNYGGIRRNSLPKGNISVGNIYELLPFENKVVVLTLSGGVLEELLMKIASSGGWPVSSGVKIKLKKVGDWTSAEDILVRGEALNLGKEYKVATIDYVANGGDQAKLLIDQPRYDTKILIRDLVIEALREKTKQGIQLNAELDQRISY